MRVLVIGGNGFIGTPLVRELLASGHEAAVFHRRADSIAGPALHIQGDRNSLIQYRGPIARFGPEVVIDLVLSSGRQAEQLLQAIHGIAQRIVAISSMDVYRAWGVIHGVETGLEPLPITEDSPLRSTRQIYPPETLKMMTTVFSWLDDHYDKIAVEAALMGQGEAPATVLRLPMVYGPGDPLHRFFPLLKRIADQRPFVLLPDDFAAWRGPRGYVEDVAHAIALAATSAQAAGRTYNVCAEPILSELDWQQKIAAHLGWKGRFVVLPRKQVPQHLLLPGNAAQHVVVSSQRIRSELGYKEVVETGEAIRRTAAWEQQNPPGPLNPQQFDYAAEDQAVAADSQLPTPGP